MQTTTGHFRLRGHLREGLLVGGSVGLFVGFVGRLVGFRVGRLDGFPVGFFVTEGRFVGESDVFSYGDAYS